MKKTAKKHSEGNPVYAIRLKAKTRRELERVSKAIGYPTSQHFLREFIEVTISGDIEAMQGMIMKAARRAMEQAQAQLPGLLDAPLAPRKAKR